MLHSLKSKFFLQTCLILALMAGLVLFFTHRDVGRAMFDAEQRSTRNILRLIEVNIQSGYRNLLLSRADTVRSHRNVLQGITTILHTSLREFLSIARSLSIPPEIATQGALDWLNAITSPEDMDILVFNNQGRILVHTDPLVRGANLNQLRGIRSQPLANVLRNNAIRLGHATTTYTWPWNADGQPIKKFGWFVRFVPMDWTIGVSMEIESLEKEGKHKIQELLGNLRTIFTSLRIGESGFVVLYTAQGELLIQPEGTAWDFQQLPDPASGGQILEVLQSAQCEPGVPVRFQAINREKEPHQLEAYCSHFPALDWHVAVVSQVAEINAPAKALVARLSLIIGVTLFASLALGLLFIIRLTNPLNSLANYAKSLPKMDFNKPEHHHASIAPLPKRHQDEVGRLASALIYMENSLRENIHSLMQSTIVNQRMLGELTERRRVEAELKRGRDLAQAANQAKSQFLANMSHEIRTPMNALLGFAYILERDTSLNDKQIRHVRTILRNGEHLLNLINDILDMSKIEADHVELHPKVFDLPRLLYEMESLFRPNATTKGIDFLLELAPDLPCTVHADQAKLRQILINLLGNAVKFTASGWIILRAQCLVAEKSGHGPTPNTRIEVLDSGPGIDLKNMDTLFDPFFQTAQGIESGGTGLGLAISHRYARLMGGDLTVSSEPGQGSCFQLDIALKPVSTQVLPSSPARRIVNLKADSGPWRILAVDDKADNLELLVALLEPVGFATRKAENGVEALRIIADWHPHVVLLDMRMPVMDGFETARRIKARPDGPNIKVVAVTAGAFKESRQDVLDAGVDAYLAKPFQEHDLFAMLAQVLDLRYVFAQDHTIAQPSGSTSPSWPRQWPKVLPPSLPPGSPALDGSDISPESAGLDPEMAQALLLAVKKGEVLELMGLIQNLEEHDQQAARYLRSLAENFNYKAIEAWIRGRARSDSATTNQGEPT